MISLIFNVHENYIEICEVSKIFNVVKIKKVIKFTPSSDMENNSIELKKLLLENKITSKKVDVILSIDSIVTRQIEIPAMKEKDLKNFINNNIGQYFTVNTGDFYFDYKTYEIVEEEKKKILSVLLVAVPKEKLYNIKILLKLNELIANKVRIYPECLVSYYRKDKKQSIAVLDVNSDKSSITIINKGKIFVYSTSFIDMSEIDGYSELTDNFTYFLNFYSSRNFGNKVDNIYVVGEKSEDIELVKTLSDNIDMDITYEKKNNYIEVLGNFMEAKAIYSKSIDFKEALNDALKNKQEDKEFTFAIIGILLLVVTGMSGYYYRLIYLKEYNNVPSPALLAELKKYSEVEKKIVSLNNEKQNYQKKVDVINEVKNDEFNYLLIIDGLKNGLPESITVNFLYIEKEIINITLNINNNTLDAARAVIAINNTNLFELIDIREVKLDDTVNSISLDLKPKERLQKYGENPT